MPVVEEVHVGDIGTIFRVTLMDGSSALDVSGASTLQIIFKKPDNSNDTQTAVFTTDGTDGVVQYTSIAGDLDAAGKWAIQANVVLPAGSWKSNVSTFRVHENL